MVANDPVSRKHRSCHDLGSSGSWVFMAGDPEQQHLKPEEPFAPGDIYEDCANHPCLCVGVVDNDDDEGIWGISLIDGSYPRSCSLYHCGVRKLTVGEAWEIKRRIQKIAREGV